LLNLGFHYHIPALIQQGQTILPSYLGRFIDCLADNCASLICFMHSPRLDEISQMDYPIHSGNVRVIDLGLHASLPRRMLTIPTITQIVRGMRSEMDCMLIRGPSPLLPTIAKACAPIPTPLLLVGDQLAGINDLQQPRWRKAAIRAFWTWNETRQIVVAKRSLTFVNSRLLYKKYEDVIPNLIETRTTTLTAADFYERQDTCLRQPIRLLYTGRMARAKGILDILEAVNILVNSGEDVTLDLVGMLEKNDTALEDLLQKAGEYGIADRVTYHGCFPVGEQLFQFYKKADIYVIASQSSFEGFPRTIWEAMAHSLPVVATRVGSIPAFIEGTSEIVRPGNFDDLVMGIMKLIHSPDIRQRYIKNGRELVKRNTLEYQVRVMVNEIDHWLSINK